MKKFTKENAIDVIDYYADEGIKFDSFDIKDELRKDGFYAIQSDVDNAVREIMKAYSHIVTSDNKYLITDEDDCKEENECSGDCDSCKCNKNTGFVKGDCIKQNCIDLRFIYENGKLFAEHIDVFADTKTDNFWEPPVGKTISFIYNGGTYAGQRRECIIKECLETKILGMITENDPAFSYNESLIRNFSYYNMKDAKVV